MNTTHLANKTILFSLILLIRLVLPNSSNAQQTDANNNINSQFWFDYNASFKINNKLYYGGDAGYRVDGNNQGWNRLYIRPSINGFINSTFSYKAGIGLFNTFYKESSYTFEARPFQDLKISWLDVGPFAVHNRFRLEEQFFISNNQTQFQFRFRYLMGVTTSDYKIFSKKRDFYNLAIFEGFLPFGKGVGFNNFTNMYRIYFAMGYRINKKVRVEAHYIWQYAKPTQGAGFEESQDVFRLRVYHNFYGGKKKNTVPDEN